MDISDDELKEFANRAVSLNALFGLLGRKVSGAGYVSLKRRLGRIGVDVSKFSSPHGARARHPDAVLMKRPPNSRREHSVTLREALLQSGRPYRCERCGNDGVWLGEALTLQVDHKDGDFTNSVPENVRFLCANCHSQTPGHSIAKSAKARPSTEHECSRCRAKFMRVARKAAPANSYCSRACSTADVKNYSKSYAKVDREILRVTFLECNSYLATSKKLGISDVAVKKAIVKNFPELLKR